MPSGQRLLVMLGAALVAIAAAGWFQPIRSITGPGA